MSLAAFADLCAFQALAALDVLRERLVPAASRYLCVARDLHDEEHFCSVLLKGGWQEEHYLCGRPGCTHRRVEEYLRERTT